MRGPTHSRKWCSSLVRWGGGEGMIRRRIIGGTGRTGDQGIDKSKSPHQVRNRGTGAKNGSQEREPRTGAKNKSQEREPRTGAKIGIWVTRTTWFLAHLGRKKKRAWMLESKSTGRGTPGLGAGCMARGTIQWVWGHRSSGSGGDSNPTLSMLRDSSTC
jgi:hypothetical protein